MKHALALIIAMAVTASTARGESEADLFRIPSVVRLEAGSGPGDMQTFSIGGSKELRSGYEIDGRFDRLNYQDDDESFATSRVEIGAGTDPLEVFPRRHTLRVFAMPDLCASKKARSISRGHRSRPGFSN